MNYKSLGYFALVNKDKSPGVIKKIENTVVAAQQNGLEAQSYVMSTSLKGVFSFFKSLICSKSQVVMIRFSDLVFPLVFFVMIWLRIRGKKVIVDVPTPRVTGLREMDTMVRNPIKRYIRKSISYISASWVLMPANLIIQYASEGKWFSQGLRNKTHKMGNGILITDNIPLIRAGWPSKTLNLIAVAQLANWHGYDRMIMALAELKNKCLPHEVTFTIVGDGEALPFLKAVAKNLNLDNINFTGRLMGDDLDKAFENSHVGVASLGLYRICLNEASVLKTREYMSRGLPVIVAGKDPDFDCECSFRVEVNNSEEINSIVNALENLPKLLDKINCNNIRKYALDNLTLEKKLKYLINRL